MGFMLLGSSQIKEPTKKCREEKRAVGIEAARSLWVGVDVDEIWMGMTGTD